MNTIETGMPVDLVLVRHGQSEANVIHGAYKRDPEAVAPEGFHDRHDSLMRLSALGIRQAVDTGDWLRKEFPEGFDRYFTSTLNRTLETAGHLALQGAWEPEDRWRERDWGEYGALTPAERTSEQYARTTRMKEQNPWYWTPPGGESLASGVSGRFRNILGTLNREASGQQVIAVTHGETMEVARFMLEKLLPSEWNAQQKQKEYKLENCQVLHYSRRNPETGEIADRMEWRRAVCAWDETKSWNEGEWVHIPKRTYTDEQLLEFAHVDSPLLAA